MNTKTAKPTVLQSGSSRRRVNIPPAPVAYRQSMALERMKIVWYFLFLSAFSVPTLIFLTRLVSDSLPLNAGLGAFIMAGGALAIVASFPIANRFRTLSMAMLMEYKRYKKLDEDKVKKLFGLMVIGAVLAELPSLAGLLHYLVTREAISSMLLCVPAVVLMFAIYSPLNLEEGLSTL